MDAAPAAISPLCSPLVARVGLLYRQSGIIKQWKPALGVLTRDAHFYVFALPDGVVVPGAAAAGASAATAAAAAAGAVVVSGGGSAHANETGTHPDVLSEVARWSVERAGGAPPPPPSPPAEEPAPGGGGLPLPPPALPAHLIQLCAVHSVNVGDLAGVGDLASAARALGSDPPTQHTYALTPATRVEPAPAQHPHALELSDKAGWFGSTRLPFRCLSASDAAEWRAALGAMVEQAGVLAGGA